MPAVAHEVSLAHVEAELAKVELWAQLHGWELQLDTQAIRLAVRMRSKIDGELYALEITFEDYRAMPPFFEFVHPTLPERGTARCYPGGGKGYFHSNVVICAPWNRKAYAAHGGPHGDWVMTSWATIRPNHSQLGDMLVLIQDLLDDRSSYTGRMAR